ncbi:MAG: TetR/AcrR family transcriptional regulator [Acidimicrobiales bacterium]
MEPATTTNKDKQVESHRGRPLDTSRDVALREAALELLAEIGYDRLTIDAVATRARASKVTIYRRWSGKAELVVDALSSLTPSLAPPDTGSLRGDLEALAHGSGSASNRFDAKLMIGLITAQASDPELRQVFRERFSDQGKAGLRQVFERAVARGEIPKDRNLELLMSLFPALLTHHLLNFGELPEASFFDQMINEVLLPLAAAPTSTPTRNSARRRRSS